MTEEATVGAEIQTDDIVYSSTIESFAVDGDGNQIIVISFDNPSISE
eukprot:CAMPEP_0170555046 /NCGR_PEP_ID=MMETSP0211-20121228/12925_1 /TAXON_ID=311385 /ORGANISM="Pseudokeronopsis sp., Strain OXSARD2" /LENGTH=46 /DNA_ID= /DNA_START= /DNA_END= /DNA_ORIENTATION=